jgi:DNA-binding NtrC family response regulator
MFKIQAAGIHCLWRERIMRYQFLIVDGENGKDLTALVRSALPEYDISLLVTADCNEGLRLIASNQPNVILYDMCLTAMSGLEFLCQAKKIYHAVSIIMTTGCSNINDTIETIKHGAFDYLTKPPDKELFTQVVRKALECSILNRRVSYVPDAKQLSTSESLESVMVGTSPKLMEIWKLVGKIADNDAPVLIQGESGTGKELLAKAIYNHSNRHCKPFLAINCAAIPETLLESELFGHEKGAFTDAHQRRIGKFEHCNGGTILLDEIGEISLPSQSKLLRVLENQQFERIGGNETIKTDVRVIASTNISLEEAVQHKLFRLDLYHRLKGISINLPPLRERQEDIPILTDLFCRIFSARYGKRIVSVSNKAQDFLLACPWSGNIRELKNVISSAVAIADGDVLLVEDLCRVMPEIPERAADNSDRNDYYAYFVRLLEPKVGSFNPDGIGGFYQEVSQGLEKATIELALKKSGNNQVLTAKMLGMSRNTLRNRIERYSLDPDASRRQHL